MTTINQEFTSPVAPGRLFKALVLDSHKLFPKLMPQFIQSIDIIEGHGGAAGSIEQVNFTESFPYKYAKHRVNELDGETLTCKYAMIEGDPLGNKLESIEYEVKFESGESGGGCICKMRSEYHALNGHEMKEEEIMSGKESALELFKAVEAYLLDNPLVYA